MGKSRNFFGVLRFWGFGSLDSIKNHVVFDATFLVEDFIYLGVGLNG